MQLEEVYEHHFKFKSFYFTCDIRGVQKFLNKQFSGDLPYGVIRIQSVDDPEQYLFFGLNNEDGYSDLFEVGSKINKGTEGTLPW